MAEQDIEEEAFKPTRVRDPETGERLLLDITDQRFRDALAAFHDSECRHPITEKMRVTVANGAIQLRECCTTCGERVGSPLPQKPKAWADSLPIQPPELANSYQAGRREEKHAFMLRVARIQFEENGAYTKAYKEYSRSEKWRAKRQLVLKRCGGVCEGCGLAKVDDIHHTTYAELGNEFLFDLLGLCRPCHQRVHASRTWLPDDMNLEGDE